MGIDRLNDDCLCSVIEWVDNVSPRTTRDSLRFVNRDFYAITKVISHRRKVLYLPGPNHGYSDVTRHSDAYSWLQNDAVLRGLRHLTVRTLESSSIKSLSREGEVDEESEQHKFDELVTLITKVGSLKTLAWAYHGAVPVKILEALHKHHAQAELHVYDFTRTDYGADQNDQAEIALSKSPALTVIRACVWRSGRPVHPDLREAAFKRVVANAPNLRSASIITGRSGCVIYRPSAEQKEELEKLTAEFLTHPRPNPALRSLTLDGYRLDDSTLKDWGKLVDLSKLEYIKCSRGTPTVSYFTCAPQVLKHLKHVSLNLSVSDNSLKTVIQEYISEIAPLEGLSLWSWMDRIPLNVILSRHGNSLRTLQLHEREVASEVGESPRKLLTVDDLKSIQASCPNLKDLTIDLDRNTDLKAPELELDLEAEKLQVLASMNLDKLQIYYDLGISYLAFGREGSDEEEEEEEVEDLAEQDMAQSISSPRSSQSPPRKRLKQTLRKGFIRPSTPKVLEPFVKALWKLIFGHRSNGAHRALDLKFGEWERKMGTGYPASWVLREHELKTWWLVRPAERDDMLGECVVERNGGTGPAFDS